MVCEDVVEVSVRLGIVLQNINKLVIIEAAGLIISSALAACAHNKGNS